MTSTETPYAVDRISAGNAAAALIAAMAVLSRLCFGAAFFLGSAGSYSFAQLGLFGSPMTPGGRFHLKRPMPGVS